MSEYFAQRRLNPESAIQSAKLNGHDPYIHLKEILEQLPTQQMQLR